MKNIREFQIEFIGIILASLAAVLIGFFIIFLVSEEPMTAITFFLLEPFGSLFNFGTIPASLFLNSSFEEFELSITVLFFTLCTSFLDFNLLQNLGIFN